MFNKLRSTYWRTTQLLTKGEKPYNLEEARGIAKDVDAELISPLASEYHWPRTVGIGSILFLPMFDPLSSGRALSVYSKFMVKVSGMDASRGVRKSTSIATGIRKTYAGPRASHMTPPIMDARMEANPPKSLRTPRHRPMQWMGTSSARIEA